MEVILEKARREHLDAIFRLLEIANMHHIPSAEMPELTFENYYVALVDGEVAGFCGFKILSEATAKTELMVVDPKFRGSGIGLKLQRHRMDLMRQRGVVTLTTNADLPQTIEWYKKNFGYREVGKLKKVHDFGSPQIDHWTTLEVQL